MEKKIAEPGGNEKTTGTYYIRTKTQGGYSSFFGYPLKSEDVSFIREKGFQAWLDNKCDGDESFSHYVEVVVRSDGEVIFDLNDYPCFEDAQLQKEQEKFYFEHCASILEQEEGKQNHSPSATSTNTLYTFNCGCGHVWARGKFYLLEKKLFENGQAKEKCDACNKMVVGRDE